MPLDNSFSLSLSRSPSPFVSQRLPDDDPFFADYDLENFEDSMPWGLNEAQWSQEAYSFQCEIGDGSRDAPSTTQADVSLPVAPLPVAPANLGCEVGNMPTHASPLRVGSAPENVLPPPSADNVPFYVSEDECATAQVESSLANAEGTDEGEDEDDNDFFNFGEDLDDEVVYYPFAATHDGNDSEEEVVKDEDEDGHEDQDDEDDEDAGEDDNGDRDVAKGELKMVCRPVSPDATLVDCDIEDESVVGEGEEVLGGSMSPCTDTTSDDASISHCMHTEDREDSDTEAAPTPQNRRKTHPPPTPTMAALTNRDKRMTKCKKTAFLIQHCLIEPDVVVECQVLTEEGQKDKPCGLPFARRDIEAARAHFRNAHFPEAQQHDGIMVVCPWPKCQEELDFRDTGRHFEIHMGVEYNCPRCRIRIKRSDSLFRHMRSKTCQKAHRRANLHPSTSAGGKANQQLQALTRPKNRSRACTRRKEPQACARTEQERPQAAPSTQRKRASRACAQRGKPQPLKDAERGLPQTGPSRGQKRSRRCLEEEEKENVPDEDEDEDEDVEVDNDNDDDPDYVPSKSGGRGKGKGKGPERKRRRT